MKSALIIADGAPAPAGLAVDAEIRLWTAGHLRNVRLMRLSFEGLEDQFLQRLSPAQRDLLRIAAYVYGADTRLPAVCARMFSLRTGRGDLFSARLWRP